MNNVSLKKKNYFSLDSTNILVIFAFFMKNCMYLIDVSTINVQGHFNYADIWLGIFVIYIIWVLYKFRHIHYKKYMFGWIVFFQIVLCFVAAFQEHRLTGQSIMLGVRPQRFLIVILLSYFALAKLFAAGSITYERIKEAFFKFGMIESVVYLVQHFSYPNYIFLYCDMNVRYGSVRLYLDGSIIIFCIYIAAGNLFRKQKIVQSVVMVGLGMIFLMFVTKSRWAVISVCFALAIGFLLMKKYSVVKLIYFLVAIIALAMLVQTPIFKDIVDVSGIETENYDGEYSSEGTGNTMEIRYEGRKYYFEVIKKHPIFGGGRPNELYEPAVKAAGKHKKYNLNDNGVFGYMYIYGLMGLAFWLIWNLKMIIISFNLYRKKNEYMPIMYVIMSIVISYNILLWYWDSSAAFIFVVIMALIENLTNGDTYVKKRRM